MDTTLLIGILVGTAVTWLVFFVRGRTDIPLWHGRRLYAGFDNGGADDRVDCNLNLSDEVHDKCGGTVLEVHLLKDRRTRWSLLGKNLYIDQILAAGWFCPACSEFIPDEDFGKGKSAEEVRQLQADAEEAVRQLLSFLPKQ
jgi:hypothetical protein